MNTKAYLLQQLTRPLLESAVLHFVEGHLATIGQTVQTLQVMTRKEP